MDCRLFLEAERLCYFVQSHRPPQLEAAPHLQRSPIPHLHDGVQRHGLHLHCSVMVLLLFAVGACFYAAREPPRLNVSANLQDAPRAEAA